MIASLFSFSPQVVMALDYNHFGPGHLLLLTRGTVLEQSLKIKSVLLGFEANTENCRGLIHTSLLSELQQLFINLKSPIAAFF